MADKYQKHDQISHVRARPDTYIGSIINTTDTRWILEKNENKDKDTTETEEADEKESVVTSTSANASAKSDLKMTKKECKFNPGLEQCIVELIVNAIDHAQRTMNDVNPVTKIDITLTDTEFIIQNNGTGIPIEIHKKEKIWVPEMIFGNMLTSSNYDDNEKRTWGGTNGIGAKASNIFSREFILDLCTGNQRYEQTFSNGMTKKTEPVISKCRNKDYTKITFRPDFPAFKLKSFSMDSESNVVDNIAVITKRVYDASAVTSKKVAVSLNDVKLEFKDFKDYCSLFIGPNAKKIVYEQENWSVIFAVNPYDENTQISFVNGLFCKDNGTHTDHVFEPVIKKVVASIQDMQKVKKENITIKPNYIRENLIVFVKCLVENPRFNSQTKDELKTSPSTFPVKCVIPDDVITKITKLDIVSNIIDTARIKELKDMKKATTGASGSRKTRILDVPKLSDASNAGTKKSSMCTLILTEGDSAKAMALAGIAVVGSEIWGAFPLRGKLLNVKNASVSQLAKNQEIININKIMGLSYLMEDKTKLRYGKIMIMADSDDDGIHIKGLLMNYFSFFCPKLMPNLITSLLTPVVKVTFKGPSKKTLDFYDNNTFNTWKKKEGFNLSYSMKYYKGLGTSTALEAKEYFRNIKNNQVEYIWSEKEDLEAIDLAFNDKRADDRKEWISKKIESGTVIDYTKKQIPIKSFIYDELVLYSIYSCMRALPNVIDGLKTSQRKVLYGSILKGIYTKKQEIKVAQLSSYIAEKSHYAHGETSLQETITKLAYNFVGTNNLQLLENIGQFGTRNQGGADAASPRYIFTCLKPYIPIIFQESDSVLLEYNYEDSDRIEPKHFAPIIPMILVNGANSIGTGWSCTIPCFNPLDIIDRLKKLLKDEDYQIEQIHPHYRGFRGTICEKSKNKWVTTGVVEKDKKDPKKIVVKELPIGYWYEDFKEELNKLEANSIINSYKSKIITLNDLDYEEFEITFEKEQENPISLLKLESAINSTNMVCFDPKGNIKKYDCPEEILWSFYEYRIEMYIKRKASLEKTLEHKLLQVSEKSRFIKLVIDNVIVVFRTKRSVIIDSLKKHKFHTFSVDTEEDDDSKETKGFNYLLNLQINVFTEEKIDELNNEIKKLQNELDIIRRKSHKDLWLDDLVALEKII